MNVSVEWFDNEGLLPEVVRNLFRNEHRSIHNQSDSIKYYALKSRENSYIVSHHANGQWSVETFESSSHFEAEWAQKVRYAQGVLPAKGN